MTRRRLLQLGAAAVAAAAIAPLMTGVDGTTGAFAPDLTPLPTARAWLVIVRADGTTETYPLTAVQFDAIGQTASLTVDRPIEYGPGDLFHVEPHETVLRREPAPRLDGLVDARN